MKAPPLLVSFSAVEDLVASLPDAVREAHEPEILKLHSAGLPAVISVRAISTLFNISAEFVNAISRTPQRHYRKFQIRKGKKTRDILAPRVALKVIQRWIATHLAASIRLPSCVFGFVPGKSVIDAASVHCDATWVYSLDLRDFFPSITARQVYDAIRSLGYSEDAASLVMQLCTLNGSLPQGSPASPVLSNLVFRDTDVLLSSLAAARSVRYSRYADDLVFSGLAPAPADLQTTVKAVLLDAGWKLAIEKEHLAALPNRLKVHGLLVHGSSPRLTKGYRKKIRAYRHLTRVGKVKPADASRIAGHLAYASSIEKFTKSKE